MFDREGMIEITHIRSDLFQVCGRIKKIVEIYSGVGDRWCAEHHRALNRYLPYVDLYEEDT